MNKKFLAMLMFSTAMLASTTSFAAGKDGVAAVVNGKNIIVSDSKVAYEANPKVKEKTSFDEFYGKTLDIFVDGEIVYQEAVKAALQAATLLSGGKVDPTELLESKIAELAPGFVNPKAVALPA